jgi:hypothetical protein
MLTTPGVTARTTGATDAFSVCGSVPAMDVEPIANIAAKDVIPKILFAVFIAFVFTPPRM